jgi:hypothetical protein
MIAGMVFKDRKHLVPMFLIEPWCLEVVGVEDHVLTSMGSRFLLCCVEELGPYPLSPKALTLSSRFAGRTRMLWARWNACAWAELARVGWSELAWTQ